jgi:outer membrane protein OmpA-like peptidoglycan-associated protein
VIVKPQYHYVGNFYEGLSHVEYRDSKIGYINTKGEYVIPQVFNQAGDFSEGLAPVSGSDDFKPTGKSIIEEPEVKPDKTVTGSGNNPGFYVFGKNSHDQYLTVLDKISSNQIVLAEVKSNEPVKENPVVADKEIQKPELTIRLTDKETNNPVKGNVILQFASGRVDTLNSDNGNFVVKFEPGSLLSYEVKARGYMPLGGTFQLGSTSEEKNLQLNKIIEGKSIVMENVLFETGKYNLLEESEKELDRIVNLMNDNPEMIISVSGYTDYLGTDELNLQLSENRVNEVVNYITSKGIPKKRISGKGYGELNPVYVGTDMEKRNMNRRVEFKIVKI